MVNKLLPMLDTHTLPHLSHHMAIADHVPGARKMVVQPGGEGAGEADLLEQTTTHLTQLAPLEVASDIVEGQ